ncbi:hypothetical protein H9P43_007932 [Blastocladiella emersonii ATCC 22665]|nr:hypothetical protein H9P43_007932 [Blastocladiella emersonii ATCC 22665]
MHKQRSDGANHKKNDPIKGTTRPQEATYETPFAFKPNPGFVREMMRLYRKKTPPPPKPKPKPSSAPDDDESSSSTDSASDFPAGFSNIHLDLAVAAIGGASSLNTPKASVSIAITEIKIAPASTTATNEGGDDDSPGPKRRAIVFMMWCHATRLAHPLCFFTYNSIDPQSMAGRINKVFAELEDKGFEVLSWSSDCSDAYHKIAELVSAANSSISWLPDPLSVTKRLCDALSDRDLALQVREGIPIDLDCVSNIAAFIKGEPCLTKHFNVCDGSTAHGFISSKTDFVARIEVAIQSVNSHTTCQMRTVLIDAILAIGTDPALDAPTRTRLRDAVDPVKATLTYMLAVRGYWERFVGCRDRIANLNHSVMTELEQIANYFIEWEKMVDDRVAQADGTAAARAALKAKFFIPATTYTVLVESIASFKSVARRLLQTGVSPVVPVEVCDTFMNQFLKDLHAATAPAPVPQIKHIQDTAVKMHRFNAALLRDAAKKNSVPKHYDGPAPLQFLVAASTPAELWFGRKYENDSDGGGTRGKQGGSSSNQEDVRRVFGTARSNLLS